LHRWGRGGIRREIEGPHAASFRNKVLGDGAANPARRAEDNDLLLIEIQLHGRHVTGSRTAKQDWPHRPKADRTSASA